MSILFMAGMLTDGRAVASFLLRRIVYQARQSVRRSEMCGHWYHVQSSVVSTGRRVSRANDSVEVERLKVVGGGGTLGRLVRGLRRLREHAGTNDVIVVRVALPRLLLLVLLLVMMMVVMVVMRVLSC